MAGSFTMEVMFDDIGVNSLMMLTICARVQEELNKNIGFKTIVAHRSIREFKVFLISDLAD
jgi:hypothetical protein